MRKGINWTSVEIDGIDYRDYPDFVDAYASYAEYEDGTELNDTELDDLAEQHADIIQELAYLQAIGA